MALEDTLFTWERCADGDSFWSAWFYRCRFVRDIGSFKKGDKVDTIYISIDQARMCVYRGEEETCFSLTLVVSPLEGK